MKKLDLRSLIIGFLMAVIFFLITGQTDNDNLGDIEVNSITVKNKLTGKDVVWISSNLTGGTIEIYDLNSYGRVAAIRTDSDNSGVIYLYDSNKMFYWGMSPNYAKLLPEYIIMDSRQK